MRGEAFVTVCIPARNPGVDLGRLMQAIAADPWAAGRRQVIVALDGPDPALERLARDAGARTVALQEPGGSYAARNAAIDALDPRTEYVIFTDADCVPQPGWTFAHLSALRMADLSGGAIQVTLSAVPSPTEYVDKRRHLRQESYVTQQGYAATANLGVRAEIARMRFDPSLESDGDSEFCQRAVAAGGKLVYTPEAIVSHPARSSPLELLRKVRRIGRGIRSRPQKWRDRPTPRVRSPRHIVASARRDGVSRGLRWDLEAAALNALADLVIALSVLRAKWAARRDGIRP